VDYVKSKLQNCVLIITVFCITKLLFKQLKINVNKYLLTLINPYIYIQCFNIKVSQ